MESLCTSWESKSMIFSLVKEHAAQVKKSQKSDFFIILHLLSIIQSLRSFLTVFRCFDGSTVFSTFVFYFFPPSVKKRHSRWTHNEMSSLGVKCKKKVWLQVVILIVFQQCISQNQSMYRNIYFTRLLGITQYAWKW